ncbi:MAG TPA: GreA/GreB family elongation factor [Gemmatimonadaceae bacterium]|nr:GreA/GreB family elongation factor [Gemmatimonadaceae bacterium]
MGQRMFDALRKKLQDEAERLRYELNVTLPAEIRRAVEMGDLRENSEYKAALERQRFVQARLGHLGERIGKLSDIDLDKIPTDRVGLGSRVVVLDLQVQVKETYHLVIGDSDDFEEGHVTISSPIGKSLHGKALGDEVLLKLPAKTRRLKIVELATIHEAK